MRQVFFSASSYSTHKSPLENNEFLGYVYRNVAEILLFCMAFENNHTSLKVQISIEQ